MCRSYSGMTGSCDCVQSSRWECSNSSLQLEPFNTVYHAFELILPTAYRSTTKSYRHGGHKIDWLCHVIAYSRRGVRVPMHHHGSIPSTQFILFQFHFAYGTHISRRKIQNRRAGHTTDWPFHVITRTHGGGRIFKCTHDSGQSIYLPSTQFLKTKNFTLLYIHTHASSTSSYRHSIHSLTVVVPNWEVGGGELAVYPAVCINLLQFCHIIDASFFIGMVREYEYSY